MTIIRITTHWYALCSRRIFTAGVCSTCVCDFKSAMDKTTTAQNHEQRAISYRRCPSHFKVTGKIVQNYVVTFLRAITVYRRKNCIIDSYSERRESLLPLAIRRCSPLGKRILLHLIFARARSGACGRPWWMICTHRSQHRYHRTTSSSKPK